jgi:hypothetical protein
MSGMALHALQFPLEVLLGCRMPDVTPVEIDLITLRKDLQQVKDFSLAFIGLNIHQYCCSSPILRNDDRLLSLMCLLDELG